MNLGLDLHPCGTRERFQGCHVDFVVEMTDIGHNRLVLESKQVIHRHHVDVSGGCNEHIHLVDNALELRDLIAVHRRLQSKNGVNFSDNNPRALAAK